MQASEAFLTLALHPLDLTHLFAQFLQEQFQSELGRRSPESNGITMAPPAHPTDNVPGFFVSRAELHCKILANAFLNSHSQ